MINWTLIINSLPLLLKGLLVSLKIAGISTCIGFILGTLLGLAQTSKSSILRILVGIYVTLMRGTPMLIQIFFMVYVLPQAGLRIPTFWAAILAIGLNSAAYISQIIRSGIASVGRGQLEAAQVLGFTRMQTIRYIVLPQAIRVVLPSLGNELITLVKDSSLASVIGVVELTKAGQGIVSNTLDALSTFTAVAALYLLVTSLLSYATTLLEKRMNRHARH